MKNIQYATVAILAGAAIARTLYVALALTALCNLEKVRKHETNLLTAYRAQHLASIHNQATTAKR